MRRMSLLLVCAAIVQAGAASAGPFDESALRGSMAMAYNGEPAFEPRYVPGTPLAFRWEGLYVGGHAGYSSASMDFGSGTTSLLDYLLRNDVVLGHVRNWTTLDKIETSKPIFGGFVGYNFQAGDLVYGFEANYNRVSGEGLDGGSSDSMTRIFQDDAQAPAQHHYFYTTTVSATATARLRDYGTIRARAGVVFDRFMPYAFGAFALGRADTNRSVTVAYVRRDIPDIQDPVIPPEPDFTFGPETRGRIRSNVFAYGYAVGTGVEVAFTPNIFMRAEYEYLQFIPVEDVKIRLNTFRAGLGLKF